MMCCLLISMCNHFVFRQSPCVLAFLLGIFFLSIKSFSLMINQVSAFVLVHIYFCYICKHMPQVFASRNTPGGLEPDVCFLLISPHWFYMFLNLVLEVID